MMDKLDRIFGLVDRAFNLVWLLFFVAASAVAGYFAWQIGSALELSLLNQLASTVASAVLAPVLIWVIFWIIRIFSFDGLD